MIIWIHTCVNLSLCAINMSYRCRWAPLDNKFPTPGMKHLRLGIFAMNNEYNTLASWLSLIRKKSPMCFEQYTQLSQLQMALTSANGSIEVSATHTDWFIAAGLERIVPNLSLILVNIVQWAYGLGTRQFDAASEEIRKYRGTVAITSSNSLSKQRHKINDDVWSVRSIYKSILVMLLRRYHDTYRGQCCISSWCVVE